MAKLIVERGHNKGHVFDLLSDNTTLGRSKHNTIQIEDKTVSAAHCLIEKRRHSYYLKDLNSTNGTFVNQEVVTEKKLSSDEKIGLGETILVFQKDAWEEGKGATTIIGETSKEMGQGKGYATLLGETVKEIKEHDLRRAVKKADKSSGVLKQILQRFGWSKNEAHKIAGDYTGKKKEDFSAALIIGVEAPKSDERIVKLKKRLADIESGNIVVY